MKKTKFATIEEFSSYKFSDKHMKATRVCPVCRKDLMQTGIDKLAYTMDVCSCRNDRTYDHVVEQLWHKSCLVKYLTDYPAEQADYRYLPKEEK